MTSISALVVSLIVVVLLLAGVAGAVLGRSRRGPARQGAAGSEAGPAQVGPAAADAPAGRTGWRRLRTGWRRPWAAWAVVTAAIGGFAAYAALTLPKTADAATSATLSVEAAAGAPGPRPSACSGPVTGTAPLPSTGLALVITVASGGAAVTGLEFAPAPSLVAAAPPTPAAAVLPAQNADSPVTSAGGAADVILSTAVILPVHVPAGTVQHVPVRVMPGSGDGQSPVTWSVTALGPDRRRLGELCLAG